MKPKIKAIIFDIGNVLVLIKIQDILKQLLKYSAITKKRDILIENHDQLTAFVDYGTGKINSHEFYKKTCEHLKLSGIGYDKFRKIWNSSFEPNKKVEKIVKELAKDYHLVVASDTNRMHFDYLKENYKILECFDQNFLSFREKVFKKDKKFFRKMIETLKIKPSQCVFIDDRDLHIKNAKFYRLNTVQYKNPTQLKRELSSLLA